MVYMKYVLLPLADCQHCVGWVFEFHVLCRVVWNTLFESCVYTRLGERVAVLGLQISLSLMFVNGYIFVFEHQ
jgi:hypothetical protein